MSLIPTSFFPRSMFDYDYWSRPMSLGMGPSTLDLFDPFDALDMALSRNLMWIDQPEHMKPFLEPTRVHQKYRITVDCSGFEPAAVRTELSADKRALTVSCKEGEPAAHATADFSMREMRRTYQLPANVDTDHMASFVTGNGRLVVEFPLKEEPRLWLSGPTIDTDKDTGRKTVRMSLDMPTTIDPTKIRVTCKDRDLVVQAEDRLEQPDRVSQFQYSRRTTLPDDTDWNHLRCTLDKNRLMVEAPINPGHHWSHRNIPVEYKKQEKPSIQSREA